jgi:hypothetical protein
VLRSTAQLPIHNSTFGHARAAENRFFARADTTGITVTAGLKTGDCPNFCVYENRDRRHCSFFSRETASGYTVSRETASGFADLY